MQQLWGYFIDVRNMHDCCMKFDYVRISLTREKYWYEIRDVLVPVLHGVKFTKCEIYGSTVLHWLILVFVMACHAAHPQNLIRDFAVCLENNWKLQIINTFKSRVP